MASCNSLRVTPRGQYCSLVQAAARVSDRAAPVDCVVNSEWCSGCSGADVPGEVCWRHANNLLARRVWRDWNQKSESALTVQEAFNKLRERVGEAEAGRSLLLARQRGMSEEQAMDLAGQSIAGTEGASLRTALQQAVPSASSVQSPGATGKPCCGGSTTAPQVEAAPATVTVQSVRTRPSCAWCVMKHLTQAAVLLQEASLGYPAHVFYAFGHLGEAESEAVDSWPDLAERIRAERLKIQDGKATGVNVEALISEVGKIIEGAGNGR